MVRIPVKVYGLISHVFTGISLWCTVKFTVDVLFVSVVLDAHGFVYLDEFSQAGALKNFRVTVSKTKIARKYLNYIDCV